ncbi:hypothetical protein BV898_19400 [Hypsibius exemplaris]|uniref:Uncharacterized protein n=1 Tax=Hypsibius exemplaris TaxID=2072580 RepID=A0A9X6NJ62_HYPEX|nr:hypothetical protein BV898_19400 [Hypsibius exemplaris]
MPRAQPHQRTDLLRSAEPRRTVNTFITGMWNQNWYWYSSSPSTLQMLQDPAGYYIDYVSATTSHPRRLLRVHTTSFHLSSTAAALVMTGTIEKTNQYSREPALGLHPVLSGGLGRPFAMAPPCGVPSAIPIGLRPINATYQENVPTIASRRAAVRDRRADRKLAREVTHSGNQTELFHARLAARVASGHERV